MAGLTVLLKKVDASIRSVFDGTLSFERRTVGLNSRA